MFGAIAAFLKDPQNANEVKEIFCPGFQDPVAWLTYLRTNLPGYDVKNLLQTDGARWTRTNFQALYVACWIFHPVEKGSYILSLSQRDHVENVGTAYNTLSGGAMPTRPSSHLSKQGISGHQGWAFLRGYEELLVQLEEGGTALFLKCEGHPLSGIGGTVAHLRSWVHKARTGKGLTASPALHNAAKDHPGIIEQRAAENYSNAYKELLKSLNLGGTMVTVAQAVEAIRKKLDIQQALPPAQKNDARELARAMLGQRGYLQVFKANQQRLAGAGVKYTEEAHKELFMIAHRMNENSYAGQSAQYFNEVRMRPDDLQNGLDGFLDILRGG